MPHVFLNPADVQDIGLIVIVAAPTGVTYQQQCGGYATEQRTLEGFLIPLGTGEQVKTIYGWFWSTFHGHCYAPAKGSLWTEELISQLRVIVESVPCWLTRSNGDDEVHHLQLDLERMDECVEAWIPVLTPYGKGILTLDNSD